VLHMSVAKRSVAAALTALGLVLVTGSASAASGQTARFNMQFQFDSLDPAIAYTVPSWQVEYATCVKLLNYPDLPAPDGSIPAPEAAAAMPKVSKDGLTYTFSVPTARYKFSPPSTEFVTASSFKRAFERSLDPALPSPAINFVRDIAGASAYNAGQASSISGITVAGTRLTIQLTRPAPDLLARLALPFFCAVPVGTPSTQSNTIPSAGPYYVASYDPGAQPGPKTVLKVNPNYKGTRPHFFDEIDYLANQDATATEAAVVDGSVDYAVDGIPLADYASVGATYGPGSPAAQAGRQQFFVNPVLGFRYLLMNTVRAFSNAALRKAVNFAIDRPALDAAFGAYGVSPTDQLLPPGMPGFRDANIYPLNGPDLPSATALADGFVPATVNMYTCSMPPCQAVAADVQSELKAIGIDVVIVTFASRAAQIQAERTPGEPWDLGVEGWIADYDDPFDIVNVLYRSSPDRLFPESFSDPAYDQKLDAAAALSGGARYAAYANLDEDLTRNAAPVAPFGNINSRDFFSARIGCQTFSPPFGMNIAALCLR
jgi:peptide/nickel transport system substrate-binding protein